MENKRSYGEANDRNLKLLIALLRTAQRVTNRSARVFGAGGLTVAQFSALEALYHKGEMTVRDLTRSVLSTTGNMTVVVANLEKEKLLARKPNPGDGRSSLLSVTGKGARLVERIFPGHLRDLARCFGALSSGEKDALAAALRKIGG